MIGGGTTEKFITKLAVAATGVANVAAFFVLVTSFPHFTEILLLATKSENLGLAGPKVFFLKLDNSV